MDEPMSPRMSGHALILYKARIDQIEFLKKQQWTVTNYLALIYAAIVWIGYNTQKSPQVVCILSATAILAAIVGIGLLFWFQNDTKRTRVALYKMNTFAFSGEERDAFDIKPDLNPFARGWHVLAALIGVSVVGAFLVVLALHLR
jgi:hypothetical protein